MAEYVQKSVKYKRAHWAGDARANLFTRLSKAMQDFPKIGKRLQTVTNDEKTRRAANQQRAFGGGMGASLIEWTEGEGSVLIDNFNLDATELNIGTLESTDKRKFLQAMAFFYVRGNHVVLLTSPVLTDGRIEEYFNWLLQRSNANTPLLSLLDTAPNQGDARDLLQNVKSIKLRPTPSLHDQDGGTTLGTELRGSILTDLLKNLRDLGGRGINPASLRNALASENVRATIEISYSGQLPADGVPLLDEVARAVAELSDEGYVIEVPRRGQLRPGDFRVRDRRNIQAKDGHPETGPAIEVMSSWLDELLEYGTVVD